MPRLGSRTAASSRRLHEIDAGWSLRAARVPQPANGPAPSLQVDERDVRPVRSSDPGLLEDPNAVPGYALQQLVGRRPGSWSTYRAQDLSADRPVTLLLFGALLNHDPDFERRLERDMPEVAALSHPNVLPVLDAGRAPRGLYLVIEHRDAEPLETTLPQAGLDLESAVRLLAPIADALDQAHARGLVHQAVGPSSLLVEDGHPLLTNFGVVDSVAAARASDHAVLAYLAPELLKGGAATPRSDVYGLAATFVRVLTGADPPVAHSLRERPPEALYTDGAGTRLQPELVDVLRRSLAPDPSRRPRSAGALIGELVRVIDPAAIPSTSAGAATGTVVRGARSRAAGSRPAGAPRSPSVSVGLTRRSALQRRRALLGIGLVAVAAAAGSLVLSGADGVDSDRAAGAVASTRELALRVPGTWSLAKDVSEIRGLPLDESMQLNPPTRERGNGAALLVGFVREADDQLLAPGFSRRLTTKPTAERVKVGRYQGYRYSGLVLRGTGQRLTLYAVPTTEGAATIACVGGAGEEAFLRRCEAVVTTLDLSRVDVRPLAPDRAYITAVNDNFRVLNARRRAGRARLAGAKSAAVKAGEAERLAEVFAAAADEQARLSRVDVPAANRALVDRLRGVREAYAGLARRARAGDAQRYQAAAAEVERREAGLAKTLDRFREANGGPGA
jgi:hypothetical protein